MLGHLNIWSEDNIKFTLATVWTFKAMSDTRSVYQLHGPVFLKWSAAEITTKQLS